MTTTAKKETNSSMRTNQPNKISEFFSTLYGLTLFTIKSLWILIGDSMKKEAQTYKEEREEQKKAAARKKL